MAALNVALLCAAASVSSEPADLVLHSNHVVTMDEAVRGDTVAIRGEHIVFVGERAEAAPFIAEHTQVVELADAAVLPGLIDAHGHINFSASIGGLANVASPPVGPVRSMSDLQDTLRSYMLSNKIADGSWVVGMGYDDSLIAEGRHPNRDDLDAVTTEYPLALTHVSGHLVAANSTALARAGITADTADPAGGHIRRYPGSTEPNGVLEETAAYPLRGLMSAPSDDPAGDFRSALENYASYGITTVQDGAASEDGIAFIAKMAAQDSLVLDVVAYPAVRELPAQWVSKFAHGRYWGRYWGRYEGRFKVGGVKLILDGSPQGRTAYMTHPYKIPPEGQSADYRGYPSMPQQDVDKLVGTFVAAGVPILAHANGDAAADMLIQAVEQSAHSSDHRTVMIHAQTVREDQLDAMQRLDMIPSYFAAHSFYWGDWHRDTVFGEARALRISPTRSTVSRNMIFTVHNDAPIVPPDMARLLWATTNRVTRSGKVLGDGQRISTYQALQAVTTFAAYQYFEEDRKGSITPGKLADLVVVATNPLLMPAADLQDLRVLRTYSHGALVYAAEHY
jgi:predicted amidohydrolase YtcJ